LQGWLEAHQAGQGHGGILMVVPTRELAAQVGDAMALLARSLPLPLKTLVVFGGVSINPQMMALRGGADVVVATPGRLLDLIDHGALDLGGVGVLVLDEADRLLDLGFADEMARLVAMLPPRRQSLFFSATFAPNVQALAHTLLNDPVRIDIPAVPQTQPDIDQRAIAVDVASRTPLLRHLLNSEGWERVMVFVATQYATELVADKLRQHSIEAAAFHGELSQGRRTEVLAAFKAQRLRVLVATDVASRGLDVVQLPAVVNYDLPRPHGSGW
jgi:superfamily II DNA/RNA helicase